MECKECAAGLSEYVDGRLDAAETTALESHIARCTGCADAARDYKLLNSVMVQTLPELEPPTARMWTAIQAQLPVREPVREGLFARALKAIFSNGLVLAPVPVALLIVAAYWAQPKATPTVAKAPAPIGSATMSSPQKRQIGQVVNDKRNQSVQSGFHAYAAKFQQRHTVPQR